MTDFCRNDKTTIRRVPRLARYDRETANKILDEGYVCHVGFQEGNDVFVLPMSYARWDDSIILHGSVASRINHELQSGIRICVAVTILDGLVLAKAIFSHSMNYRSLVAFGVAKPIKDLERKREALRRLSEHLVPGRWEEARRPTRKELSATAVLELPLTEASIKMRAGPPDDLAKDADLPIWSGVIPLELVASDPVPQSQEEYPNGAPTHSR